MKPALSDRLLLRLGPFLAANFIGLLHALLRVEIRDEQQVRDLWQNNQAVIIALWHDQLLMMVKGYLGPGSRILISPSKDGELIARIMRKFGQGAVRGSSSRGGRAAFRALVTLAGTPYDLVVTPDGPKGPRHVVKEGVVQLSRLTGRPVVPMAFACSRGHRFGSWDRFLLPYPFARAVYVYGTPVALEKGEDVGRFATRVQKAMDETCRKAEIYLEEQGVSAV